MLNLLLRLPLWTINQLEGLGYLIVNPIKEFLFSLDKLPSEFGLIMLLSLAVVGGLTWLRAGKFIFKKKNKSSTERIVHPAEKFIFGGKADGRELVLSFFSLYFLGALALIAAIFLSDDKNLLLFAVFAVNPLFGLLLAIHALIGVALAAPIYWVGVGLASMFKSYAQFIMAIAVSVFIFFCFVLFLPIIFIDATVDTADYAHHLHALVKNTCMFDPAKENCPKTVDDFNVIMTPFYEKKAKGNQVFYKISADQNEYVLVVRYAKRDVIIFSGKLDPLTGERTEDFKIYKVKTIGQDRVNNIPEFAKEFEYLPEWK